jgi:chromosome partition protein MukE
VTRAGFSQLQDVLLDADFPELDIALRRGRHVDRDDVGWYELLTQAQEHLEPFYRRYGCELVYKTDGYYYLLPTGDRLPRRKLAPSDMLVGQALALLYLDPAAVERGGRVTMEDLIAQLVSVLGSDALIRAFNPKRRRYDERVAQKTARARVAQTVRHLSTLGFVEVAEDQLRLRPALLRFAEPVRGLSEPAEALAKLVAQGEVSLETDEGAPEQDDDADADAPADDTPPDFEEPDTERSVESEVERDAEPSDEDQDDEPSPEAEPG